MSYQTLQTEYAQGIALIWMNRPKMRNALDNLVIAELTDAFSAAIEDDGVRAIVLAGRGKAFCAGADLNWLKTAREMTPDEAREDSIGLARLMRLIYESPKPTVARVQGEAIAIVGNSGELTTGPHLHFELWHRGEAVDPQAYMVFK